LLLLVCIFVALPIVSSVAQVDWAAIITQAKPAVVRIVAETRGGPSSGSGFLVAEDGLILTAAHVLEGATKITVVVLEAQAYLATVVQSDSEADVAVLRIAASGLAYLTLGDSNALAYYEEISALGYSVPTIGVGFIPARGYFIGLRASPNVTYVQFEANPLDHGHSGGPVINATGQVVGLIVGVVADQELGVFNKLAVATDTVAKILARPPAIPPRILVGHTRPVGAIAFAPYSTLLASSADDETIRLWDVTTGHMLRSISADGTGFLGFSPDGSLLMSESRDVVKLWDVATGRDLGTITESMTNINSCALSPDWSLLALGLADGTVKLWDIVAGQVLRTLRGHTIGVSGVAFSPDGTILASGSPDKTIKLWDVATGAELRTLRGHTFFVMDVAFSPDGNLLASAGLDNTVRLWDVATGQSLRMLTGHTLFVNEVAFSPDGTLLASGSADGAIKLWAVATGQLLQTLTYHTSSVNSMAFSPDGTYLASGSGDKTVVLWTVDEGK
jgi:WD40 repeat protein